jgi:hypothetical protein
MLVTKDMTTEGGTSLLDLADLLGTDGATGTKVTQDRGEVRLVVDSTSYPNEHVDLTPDDAERLAVLLILRAAEARA